MAGDLDVSKSSELVVQKPMVKARGREIARLLACPICKKLCKDAITMNRCNHTFCEKCIYEKVEAVGGLRLCPYCYEDLSIYTPDQYLRPDKTLREMIEKMHANMERDEKNEKPYQLITYTEACESTFQMDQNKDGAILKKKRSARKPHKENGMKKVESEIGIGKVSTKKLISGEKTSDKIDKKNKEDEGVCLDKFQSFWFNLSPQKDKPDKTLREMIEKMHANMERDEKNEKPYQLITYTEACESTFQMDQNKDGAILKKKRSARKPHKENGMKKVESEIGIGKVSTKKLISGEKTSDKIDKKNKEDEGVCLDKFQSFWFNLSPQKDKKAHSYPKLPRPYINVKNGDLSMPISVLYKYLMKKLNLENEEEIEVCCFGEPLIKALTLHDLYQIWIDCVSKAPPCHYNYINPVCLSAKKLVMELTYRKNIKDEAHPSTLNILMD